MTVIALLSKQKVKSPASACLKIYRRLRNQAASKFADFKRLLATAFKSGLSYV
jgi:hypothetical protein